MNYIMILKKKGNELSFSQNAKNPFLFSYNYGAPSVVILANFLIRISLKKKTNCFNI